MEELRYSFEILTKQFIDEQTRENFDLSTPSPNEYKLAEPYFTKYGITPEEAFNVLKDFDREPKDLTQDQLNTRIRALAALDNALNDDKFVGILKKTANDYASSDTANAAAMNALIGVPAAGFATISSKNPKIQFFANNIDAGIVLMRRLIGLLIMESASACSTDNCFDDILRKFGGKNTSLSDKIDRVNGIIQLDKQTIKSLNTMLSEKNNEMEKRQNAITQLAERYKSVLAERDAMAEKNKILVEESKKLITIPNVSIVVLVCIIVYLFVTKK